MLKKPLKVAILSFYSTLVSRGVETFVAELSARIPEITVYHSDKLPLPGNRLHYVFADKPSLAIKRFTALTLARLATEPPDILMALNNGWMSLLGKQFCARHKTKLVLAGFSGIGWDDKVNLWLKPDCFVAATSYQAGWAKKINPHARVAKINIGVNLERFKPEGKKYPLKLKPPVVLVVAGPEPRKRVRLAIEAVSRIKASLLVVGRQPDLINRLGREQLANRYQNLLVNYSELDAIYRSVQVYTLPSGLSEAYGISILEAMASNRPVVINDDPIRRELGGQAAVYTDPTNITAYAAALTQALKSPPGNLRQQAEKFSWAKVSREYQKLWSSLV